MFGRLPFRHVGCNQPHLIEIIYRPFNRLRVVRSPKSEGESVLPHSTTRLLMGVPAGARVSAYEFASVPKAGLRPSLSGSVGALPIVKSIFDFTHVLRACWKRIRTLSIWFIVLKFTNISLSVGPRERALPALQVVLEFTDVLLSVGP